MSSRKAVVQTLVSHWLVDFAFTITSLSESFSDFSAVRGNVFKYVCDKLVDGL